MDDWLLNVQELIVRLSVADKLWLFTHVPLSVVKSASCRSSLMQQLTDECCDVIGRFSDSASTYTVTQLVNLARILLDNCQHYSQSKTSIYLFFMMKFVWEECRERGIECVLFQNLTNLDRSEGKLHILNQNLICFDTCEKIWLSHAHLCCVAPALPVVFNVYHRRHEYSWCLWCLLVKEGVVCGALRTVRRRDTMPTTTRKICVFFFTGLDRSRLTNLDRSRFVNLDLSDFEKERTHYQVSTWRWTYTVIHRCSCCVVLWKFQ